MNNVEIKGPFSYSGNKFRIYKKYLKDMMVGFERIHEPFVGSGVCVYNSKMGGTGIDIDSNVVALHNSLHDKLLISRIQESFSKFFPNGRTKEGYLKLREDFNKSFLENGTCKSNVHQLHILIQLGFNSLLRFGSKGFNTPFGKKDIDFDRIKLHMRLAQEKNVRISKGIYSDLDLLSMNDKDLVYLDPPYVASNFQYGGWNKSNEIELLAYISKIDEMGIKFILSNTFYHRGKENLELKSWAENFDTLHIEMSYNSWSASVSSVEREDNTDEVIITNIPGVLRMLQKQEVNAKALF